MTTEDTSPDGKENTTEQPDGGAGETKTDPAQLAEAVKRRDTAIAKRREAEEQNSVLSNENAELKKQLAAFRKTSKSQAKDAEGVSTEFESAQARIAELEGELGASNAKLTDYEVKEHRSNLLDGVLGKAVPNANRKVLGALLDGLIASKSLDSGEENKSELDVALERLNELAPEQFDPHHGRLVHGRTNPTGGGTPGHPNTSKFYK